MEQSANKFGNSVIDSVHFNLDYFYFRLFPYFSEILCNVRVLVQNVSNICVTHLRNTRYANGKDLNGFKSIRIIRPYIP